MDDSYIFGNLIINAVGEYFLYRYKKTLRELELLLILYTSLSRIGWSPAADEASVCLHEFTADRIWGRQGEWDSLLRRPRPMQHESNVHVSRLWFRITQVHQASGIFDQRSNVEGPGYVNKIRWVLHRSQSASRLRFFFFLFFFRWGPLHAFSRMSTSSAGESEQGQRLTVWDVFVPCITFTGMLCKPLPRNLWPLSKIQNEAPKF